MKKGLNSKTPQWFKDWHQNHYKPLSTTVSWNTRLIFIILATILAASIVNNSNLNILGKVLGVLGG